MGSKKRLVKEISSIVVNETTGQVIETIETEVVKVVTQDAFMQVYLEDNSGLFNIKNNSELQVLLQLWKRSVFDTNEVIIVKQIKIEIANAIGTKLQNVNNTISSLKKKKLLISKARGVYFLNPKYFFKGYKENRPKVIKLVQKYIIEDGEQATEDGEQTFKS